MRSLLMVLIAVLWLALPVAGADTPAAKDTAKKVADDMKDAATPLSWFYMPDLSDRLWGGVTIKVVDRAKALELIKAEFDDHYIMSRDWNLTLPTEELWGHLCLVGLIPPDCNPRKTYLDWVSLNDAAVYDWNSKTLSVVKDQDVADLPALARSRLIVQELSNSLAQRFIFGGRTLRDIDTKAKPQHDNRIAITSVIEGSARIMASRYHSEFKRTHKDARAATNQYADYEEARLKQFVKLPLYVQSSLGTSVLGMRFLMHGKPASALDEGETGQEGLLAVQKRLPETTEEIMHPEKYYDKDKADLPILIDAVAPKAALAMFKAPTWQAVGDYTDTFGELLCSLMAKQKDEKADPISVLSPSYYINDAGSGWGGDRFFLLRKADCDKMKPDGPPPALDKVRGLWVTAWDTPKDRSEFVEAYSKANMPKDTGVVLLGSRTVVFLFNMTPQERDEVTQLIQKTPPKLTQGGKAVDL